MSQERKVLELFRNEPMDQTELASVIYENYNQATAIHSTLKINEG